MKGAELNEREAAALRSEMQQVLAAPEFVRSPVMSKLLAFLVERRIEDPQHPPKAYEVAVDALDRAPDFDVQSDSYPRVQVGRLRKMLENHYAERDGDPLIVIPKGNYALQFSTPEDRPDTQPREREEAEAPAAATPPLTAMAAPLSAGGGEDRIAGPAALPFGLIAMLAAAFAAGALLVGLFFSDRGYGGEASEAMVVAAQHPPKLYLATVDARDAPGQEALARQAMNFLEDAFGASPMLRMSSEHGEKQIAGAGPNSYRLNSRLYSDADGFGMALQLVSLDRDEMVWQQRFPFGEAKDMASALGPAVAQIGDVYGQIATDQRAHLGNVSPIGFACRLKFDEYRMMRDQAMIEPVEKCIEASLKKNPADPLILDAASFMAHRQDMKESGEPDHEAGQRYSSEALMRRARSPIANFAVARSAFLQGDCARGTLFANKATQLNPYGVDVYAVAAAMLYNCESSLSVKYAQRAERLWPQGAVQPNAVLVFYYFDQGDAKRAMAAARRIPPSNGIFSGPYQELAYAMAHAADGNLPVARKHWAAVAGSVNPTGDLTPRQVLTRMLATPTTRERVYGRLHEAGLFSQSGRATP